MYVLLDTCTYQLPSVQITTSTLPHKVGITDATVEVDENISQMNSINEMVVDCICNLRRTLLIK